MNNFIHGIDHIGFDSVSPILVLGGPVRDSDFYDRDLSKIMGVTIRQGGLDKGYSWQDLNIGLLAKKIPGLQFVDIVYKDVCDISQLGVQPCVKYLTLDCPKMRIDSRLDIFPNAEFVELRVTEKLIPSLVSKSVKSAVITRPKFKSLETLGLKERLSNLRIQFPRNLETLDGIDNFPNLLGLIVTDAPNLKSTGCGFHKSPIKSLYLDGVRKLTDISGLCEARALEEIEIFFPSKDINIPQKISNRVQIQY